MIAPASPGVTMPAGSTAPGPPAPGPDPADGGTDGVGAPGDWPWPGSPGRPGRPGRPGNPGNCGKTGTGAGFVAGGVVCGCVGGGFGVGNGNGGRLGISVGSVGSGSPGSDGWRP